MRKPEITIHKRNELVRGSDMYSLNAKKCFNALYYIYQKNRDMFSEFESNNTHYMLVKFDTLRNLMSLQKDNNYVEVIKDAITELQTTAIQLNNWTNPVDGEKYSWYSTTFLNEAYVKHDNIVTVQLEISNLFKQLINSQINFTKLELVQYMNKFRTKYAMKLYEYLKSFSGYKYIDITLSHVQKLFDVQDIKNYQTMSELKRLLNRQIKEIVKKSDLKELKIDESKELRKDKIFRIHINPKASKKTVDESKAKAVLKALQVKRF